MSAYAEFPKAEFLANAYDCNSIKYQHEVGVGYFDAVANTVSGGTSSTTRLDNSTEKAQF